jgi:hypothetical protein
MDAPMPWDGARMSLVDAPMREKGAPERLARPRTPCNDGPSRRHAKIDGTLSEKRPPWAHPSMKHADAYFTRLERPFRDDVIAQIVRCDRSEATSLGGRSRVVRGGLLLSFRGTLEVEERPYRRRSRVVGATRSRTTTSDQRSCLFRLLRAVSGEAPRTSVYRVPPNASFSV